MDRNNLFQYATKELSQDAFFCWLINWVAYPNSSLHSAGVAALNLFLGSNKQDSYFNVKVQRQYKKIDVLILFNDTYALIIEDKTNTSEHGEQIARYKKLLSEDYPDRTILTAYIKTGIIYDEDARIVYKADAVVTLDDLLRVLHPFQCTSSSDIFNDYVDYISSIAEERAAIDALIADGNYDEALKTYYGQFSFLNQIFPNRTKCTEIGKTYVEKDYNPSVFVDQIYAGTNNGGTPWAQYCFWGEQYPLQIKQSNDVEYHYLFWRVDCNWIQQKTAEETRYVPEFYIALRHYDENAKVNDATRQRKKNAYHKFRANCIDRELHQPAIFKKIGVRENYKESDLLFIPLKNISNLPFDKIKEMLREITKEVTSC